MQKTDAFWLKEINKINSKFMKKLFEYKIFKQKKRIVCTQHRPACNYSFRLCVC